MRLYFCIRDDFVVSVGFEGKIFFLQRKADRGTYEPEGSFLMSFRLK